MTDVNTAAACTQKGFKVPCTGDSSCSFNAVGCAACGFTNCGSPMDDLAMHLCSASPSSCAPFNGVFQNMGGTWSSGASCGVVSGAWCASGASFSNYATLRVA